MRFTLLIFLVAPPFFSLAQTISSQSPGAIVINVDLKNGIVKEEATVPYGTRLIFKAEVPETLAGAPLNTLYAFYAKGLCPPTPGFTVPDVFTITSTYGWMRPQETLGGKITTAAFYSPLTPNDFFLANRNYCLLVRRYKDPTDPDALQQRVSLRTDSQFSDYVKIDFGIGYSFLPKALFGTLAAHFYFVPVNNYINLTEDFKFKRQVLMRTSLFAGVAPVMLSSDTRQPIKSSTGVGNLVFGLGIRSPFNLPNKKRKYQVMNTQGIVLVKDAPRNAINVNQALRLNLGWLVFKQADTSPLVTKDHTKLAPYVSITYDASIASLLAPIALLLGAK